MKNGLSFGFHGGGGYCNNLISPIKVKIFFQIKLNYLNWKKGYKPNT